MKTIVVVKNCWLSVLKAGKNLMLSCKGRFANRQMVHSKYFTVKRNGNTLIIMSNGTNGAFGEIRVNKLFIKRTFNVLRGEECGRIAFSGMSASVLKVIRIGQNMSALLRRHDNELRLEMIQGGIGCIGFGRGHFEKLQKYDLQCLEDEVFDLFEYEELMPSEEREASMNTVWMMEHPYGYVQK